MVPRLPMSTPPGQALTARAVKARDVASEARSPSSVSYSGVSQSCSSSDGGGGGGASADAPRRACCCRCCEPVHEYFCGEDCCSEKDCNGFGVHLFCCCLCACYPAILCVSLPMMCIEGCCERCCPEPDGSDAATSQVSVSMASSSDFCSETPLQQGISSRGTV